MIQSFPYLDVRILVASTNAPVPLNVARLSSITFPEKVDFRLQQKAADLD